MVLGDPWYLKFMTMRGVFGQTEIFTAASITRHVLNMNRTDSIYRIMVPTRPKRGVHVSKFREK